MNVLLGVIPFLLMQVKSFTIIHTCRWDTELIDLSQTWTAKENSEHDYIIVVLYDILPFNIVVTLHVMVFLQYIFITLSQ